jgi:hypothetical protein
MQAKERGLIDEGANGELNKNLSFPRSAISISVKNRRKRKMKRKSEKLF